MGNYAYWMGKQARKSIHLPALYNGNIENVVTFLYDGYMMSADMNGDNSNEVILFTDTEAYIYGSSDIDITEKIDGIPAPGPQLKKYYLFTRYWGGEYTKEGGFLNTVAPHMAGKTFDMYPNPVTAKLTIAFHKEPSNNVNFTIYNNHGQVVFMKKGMKKTEELNLECLPKGYYIVKIISDGKVNLDSFIKL